MKSLVFGDSKSLVLNRNCVPKSEMVDFRNKRDGKRNIDILNYFE